MTCDFDRIDALCTGELTDTERASVLSHMNTCPACRAYYEAMAGLEGEESAPEGFAVRVMDAVRATPQVRVQRRTRRVWQRVATLAACAMLVVGLGWGSGLLDARMPAPEAADVADTAPNRSAEVADAPSAADSELAHPYGMDNGDQATDLPLTIHTLTDPDLCAQVRDWLAQQQIHQLYPVGPREAYDLTADQVKALNSHLPLLALPEEFLQLELKSAQ